MVQIKNTDATATLEVKVIRQTVTTIAPGEEKEVTVDPTQERIEIKSVP